MSREDRIGWIVALILMIAAVGIAYFLSHSYDTSLKEADEDSWRHKREILEFKRLSRELEEMHR